MRTVKALKAIYSKIYAERTVLSSVVGQQALCCRAVDRGDRNHIHA